MGQAPQPAPAGNPVHYERRRPEETTLYQVVREHLESFSAQVEAQTGASLPQFVKDEFDAFLQCGIVAHGFLRLRCGDCGHENLWPSPAIDAAFAPRAGRGAWQKSPPTWSITSSRAYRPGPCHCSKRPDPSTKTSSTTEPSGPLVLRSCKRPDAPRDRRAWLMNRPCKPQKTASFHHKLTRLTARWHLDRVLLAKKRRLNFLYSGCFLS